MSWLHRMMVPRSTSLGAQTTMVRRAECSVRGPQLVQSWTSPCTALVGHRGSARRSMHTKRPRRSLRARPPRLPYPRSSRNTRVPCRRRRQVDRGLTDAQAGQDVAHQVVPLVRDRPTSYMASPSLRKSALRSRSSRACWRNHAVGECSAVASKVRRAESPEHHLRTPRLSRGSPRRPSRGHRAACAEVRTTPALETPQPRAAFRATRVPVSDYLVRTSSGDRHHASPFHAGDRSSRSGYHAGSQLDC